MDKRETARALLASMQDMTNALAKAAEDEVAMGKLVGTSSPTTPESVALTSARVQLLALAEAVGVIGTTLAKLLLDDETS